MNRLFPIVALLLSLALGFAYVEPTYSGQVTALKNSIAGYDKALVAAKDYKAKENELVQKRDDIPRENLANLETLLPSTVNNINMILDLNALAVRSNVVLSDVEVTPPSKADAVDQGPIGSVELTLSATGSYASFRNFLTGIEKSARILDVTSLDVRGTDTGVYDYKLILKIYWLR